MAVRPRFEPVITWGHLLTAATLAGSVFIAYSDIVRTNDRQELRIDALEAVVGAINKHEGRISNNETRIGSLEQSSTENRDFQRRILEQLTAIREDIAGLKANR